MPRLLPCLCCVIFFAGALLTASSALFPHSTACAVFLIRATTTTCSCSCSVVLFRPEAERHGICKIIPPSVRICYARVLTSACDGCRRNPLTLCNNFLAIRAQDWKPRFQIDQDSFVFRPREQSLNLLEAKSRVKVNFLEKLAQFWDLQVIAPVP